MTSNTIQLDAQAGDTAALASWPAITIVTPSLNQGDYIEAAIKSINNQGYPRTEHIVVDGGSTDGTKGIINRYSRKLAWSCCEPDKGHGNALNKGFARSSGEILCWLNSDDLLAPGALWIVGELFSRFPEIDWIMGLPTVWDRLGRGVQTVRRRRNRLDHMRGRFGIQQESCFWRRSLWERTGGYIDESYKLMVDSELWSRFFEQAELWHVDAVLGGYRWHGSNRAISFSELCHEETERAFNRLTNNSSADDQAILTDLKAYDLTCQRAGAVSRLQRYILERRLRRELQAFGYRVVRWGAGNWIPHIEPYDL